MTRQEEFIQQNFRPVPKTGVIFVMHEAQKHGYYTGHPEWANLGQGAPETHALEGAPDRLGALSIDPTVSEYSPVSGAWELRAAVAELYNQRYRRGLKSQYTAENVAISPGGRSGLTRVAASLDSVNLGHFLPDYTAYEELLDLFRAFVPIPIALPRESGFQMSSEQLRREIIGRGLGAILISNPCNPTGHVISGPALQGWVDTCRELNCAFILDEFYAHYLYGSPEDPPSQSAAACVEDVNKDQVVIIDGLTKNWRYPGLRISWTLAPKAIIERIGSAGSFLDGGATHPVQRGIIPLLGKSWADREARAIRQHFQPKRDLMVQSLTGLGLDLKAGAVPQGAFYCFPELSGLPEPIRDGMAFFRKALEFNVICVPGVFFDVNPGQRRRIPSRLNPYVRLSFGPTLAEVQRGLTQIKAMIESI